MEKNKFLLDNALDNETDNSLNNTERDRKRRAAITYDKATDILTDRYHNGMSVADVKRKHNISHKTWIDLNTKLGEVFKNEMGVKTKKSNELNTDEYLKHLKDSKRRK
jgi:hypothetical protein